jgi:hypothetical protein
MDTDKPSKDSKPHRDEFEVAYYTKELGRTLQRKMLQQQMDASGSSSKSAHGEDGSFDSHTSPPLHDRAG